MISVQLPDEPPDFRQRVRDEGLAHLQEQHQDPDQPRTNPSIWKRRTLPDGTSHTPDYWRRAREAIKKGYANRCVYTCFKLEDETYPDGIAYGGQIDHFKPRDSSAAKLAYDWYNLRWAWAKVDSEYKQNKIIPDDHDPARVGTAEVQGCRRSPRFPGLAAGLRRQHRPPQAALAPPLARCRPR